MLTQEERQEAVARLIAADETKTPCLQLSTSWPHITVDDAYGISGDVAAAKIASGKKVIGHKVGLTSKAMQASSQIDEPDFGYMFDDMLLNDGAVVDHSNFCIPRVEPELTFVLKDGLKGPNVSIVEVLRATEFVIPSIEIIDARVQNPRKIMDTVSDNGAAAGLVLGGRPVRPDDVDLRWVGALFHRNGQIEETGLAAGVLGHPAMAVAWLANKISGFGVSMEPGHMVLTGSFTRPVWADKGDTLQADFGALGTVAVAFQ